MQFFIGFIRVVAVLSLATLVVFVGWHEPLRYRFMSPPQIAQEEMALAPRAATRPGLSPVTGWQLTGTALDRAPYTKAKNGEIEYSNNLDFRKSGTPTETGYRPNTVHYVGQ